MPRIQLWTAHQMTLHRERIKRRHNWRMLRRCLGAFACQYGDVAAAKAFGEKPDVARYWRQKISDPNFHPAPHGGFTNKGLKFGQEVDDLIQAVLWRLVHEHPGHTIEDFVNEFRTLGVPVKRNFVQRIFSNWRWSWKRPAIQHVRKYLPENIRYYAEWVTLLPQLPLEQLKFCDESHFVSRHLHRNRIISPIGVPRYLHDTADLSDSFSLTLLCDLSNPLNPFYIDLRAESNSEDDFLAFVQGAITAQRLRPGDFFIVDNASIHFGAGTRTQLRLLFARHNITYLFLPTYSPELNPCELVFSYVKSHIRTHRSTLQIPQLVLQALSRLSFRKLVAFYNRCVNIQNRIP